MGLSIYTTTYNGGSKVFPINFVLGYLNQSDVKVQVNSESTFRDFTWVDDSNIEITSSLNSGDVLTFTRTTNKSDLLVNFSYGSNITAENLDLQAKQLIMLMHEIIDGRTTGLEEVIAAAYVADDTLYAAIISAVNKSPELISAFSDLRDKTNFLEQNVFDIQNTLDLIENEVNLLDSARENGVNIYPDLASLNADLTKDEFSVSWIYEDANPANNGQYRKVGTSGTGSWTRVSDLPEVVFEVIRNEVEALRDAVVSDIDSVFNAALKDVADKFPTLTSFLVTSSSGPIGTYEDGVFTVNQGQWNNLRIDDVNVPVGTQLLIRMRKVGVAQNFYIQLRSETNSNLHGNFVPTSSSGEYFEFALTTSGDVSYISVVVDTRGVSDTQVLVSEIQIYPGTLTKPLINYVPATIRSVTDELDSHISNLGTDIVSIENWRSTAEKQINKLYALSDNTAATAIVAARAFNADPLVWVGSDGDDINTGSEFDPLQSYEAATAQVEFQLGSGVILDAGQEYLFKRGGSNTNTNEDGVPSGYPQGFSLIGDLGRNPNKKPVLSERSNLSGLTWTLDSGSIWTTTYTLSDLPPDNILNGVSENTFNFAVWGPDGLQLNWVVGGTDIAANKSAMVAGSMVCHFTGSTVQDLRGDRANKNTSITLFVWLADGSDPNGQELTAIDYHSNILGTDAFTGAVTGVEIGYNWDKDNTSWAVDSRGRVPMIGDITHIDCPVHGGVGPRNVVGTYKFVGRGVEGRQGFLSSTGTVLRRSGGGINLFTNTYYPGKVLYEAVLDLTNPGIGLYAHGSGNKGYEAIVVGLLKVFNGTHAARFDNPSTGVGFVDDGLYIQSVDIERIDNAFTDVGNLTVLGGRILFADDDHTLGTAQTYLVNNQITDRALTWFFDDVEVKNLRTYQAFSSQPTLVNTSAASVGRHKIIFGRRFRDTGDLEKRLHLPRGSGLHPIDFVSLGGAEFGDLQPKNNNIWPTTFIVGGGETFSFGGRSFDDTITAMNAAGVTHNLLDFMSTDFTILEQRPL